jgi:hypothetical protein
MCAKQSHIKPAPTLGLKQLGAGSGASVSSWSALYRVLRGGRQRPSRSVDRKAVDRNESEVIEPRQILRVRMPRRYVTLKAISAALAAVESGGVRVHGMWPRFDVELGRSAPAILKNQGGTQDRKIKRPLMQETEVRCFHSSGEVR